MMDLELFEKIGKISWSIPVFIWIYLLYFEKSFLNIAAFVVTTVFVSLWYINKKLKFIVGFNTRFLYIILSMVILDILYIYSLITIYQFATDQIAHFLFWIGIVAIIYGHIYSWIKTSLFKDSIKMGYNLGQIILKKIKGS